MDMARQTTLHTWRAWKNLNPTRSAAEADPEWHPSTSDAVGPTPADSPSRLVAGAPAAVRQRRARTQRPREPWIARTQT
jgi:hypothetical protein